MSHPLRVAGCPCHAIRYVTVKNVRRYICELIGIKIANCFRHSYFYSVHRTSVQETEEVFVAQYREECKTNSEVDAPLESATKEQATRDNQDNLPQVGKRL